ncbi:MAG: hypothetical protein IPJ78_00915 [Gemmatimonadetes bacterium]|nr:hypothetical protein [Gemmatimonadota bacterium]
MPRFDRPTFRRAVLFGAACLLATLSCGREVTGPPGMSLMRGFAFDARFDAPGLAHGVAGTLVDFTDVRVVLVNATGDTVVKRVIPFPNGADSVELGVDVPVSSSAPASGELMSLALAFINAQGDTVFRGGPVSVPVVPSRPGQAPPPAPQVPVNYTGPGSQASVVEIAPGVTTILSGDPFAFVAAARDAQGQPIAGTPIAWRSADTTRARINTPGAGTGITLPARGPVAIIAQLLTGPADTVVLDIQPRAQALQFVSGNNQSGTFNTPLSQPLVVRVNATDGQGMAGVAVNFAVTSGGGSVSSASVVTDASGLAQVTWTVGSGLGAQTVTATATGLVGSPLTFTAQLPTAELLHHYPMNGDLADAVGGANGTLFGGASVSNGVLTLDGTTGYAEFASAVVPTSGSYTVSMFVRAVIQGDGAYLSQGTSGGPGLVIGYTLGQIDLAVGDGGGSTGVQPAGDDGLFHQIALVVDSAANQSRLYQDGVQVALFPTAIVPAAGGTNTRLGRAYGSGGSYILGDFDEFRVHRGALTPAQVTALYTTGVTTLGRLVFGTQPTNVVSGAAMTPAVVVRAEDALGRLKTDYTGPVTLALANNPRGGTLGGTLTVNAVGGIATFAGLSVDSIAAGYTLLATSPGIASVVSTPFAVQAGAATALEFVQQPTNAAVSAAIAPPITVRVRDALGNTVTGFNGNVTLALGANPGGATLGGTTTAIVVGGLATFSTITLSSAATGYTLVASSGGLTSATSAAFDIGVAVGGINEWIAAGGTWDVAGNWSLGRAPIPTDTVRLNAVGTYTVVLAEDATVARVEIGGAGGRNATLSVDGTFTLTTTEGVQVNGPGILSLELGAIILGAPVANDGLIRSNGGSIAADLVHNGSLLARGTTVVSGAVTTTAVSAIDIEANAGAGDIGVSFANGFTNNGDILLTSTGGVFDAGLAFSTGTLVNGAGGTITFAAGTGGARTFFGRLDNQGTITVATPSVIQLQDGANTNNGTINVNAQLSLGISGVAPTFTNFDTIVIASGQVLGLTAGSFTQASGALMTGGGSLAVTSGAALRLLNGAVLSNVANSGLMEVSGASSIGGSFSMNSGSFLRIGAIGAQTAATTLTLASGFTNSGVIQLTNQTASPQAVDATLQLSAGTLTNAVGGLITTAAGNGGGTRSIVGPVLNQGLLEIAPGAAGQLAITGNFTGSSGTVAVDLGGLVPVTQYDQLTISGTATLGGTLNVGLFGGFTPTPGSSFDVLTAGTRTGTFGTVNAAAGLQAAPSYSATGATVLGPTAGLVNAWTSAAGGNWSGIANWSLGRTPIATDTVSIAALGTYTVTMDVGDTVAALFVGGGAGTQTLAVVGRTLQVDGDASVATSGALTISTGGIVRGAGTLTSQGAITTAGGSIQKALTNAGTVTARGAMGFTQAVTNNVGAMLRVSGESTTGAATPTFGGGVSNAGNIEFTTSTTGYNLQMTVTGGALTNLPAGTITSLVGTGGTRTITGTIDNQGTIALPADLTVTGVDAAHVNSGTITMTTGDLTVTMTGTTPSFTNTGTIAVAGRTFTVTGGTLDLSAGVVTGYTGRLVTSGAPTVRFSVPTVQPRVTFSATTVLPDPLTVPAGDSLRILGGTFAPPSLTNNGLLVLEGAPTITSAVTTGTGSTIRVRGSSAGGGPTATFTNPLTNAAAIELTAETAGYNGVLVVPTLTNTATGTLTSLAGSGGTRTFTGTLVNAGTVTLPHDLSITGASAAHVNSGTITMTTGDLAVTMTGTSPSFTNTGTIAVAGRTFTVTGGTLDLLGGVVTGYSGRLVTTGTPTVRFTVPTVQPRVTFSATTVLPDPFTVPAGDSLRILGGTFAPPSLTNDGLLLLEGAPTITSAVTTGTGSTIRVRGSSAGGGPTATFTNPLTNAAAIELTAEAAGYNGVLIVPTLTNTATGTLTSLVGSGGTRTFTGTLLNAGAVNIPHDLSITGASAAHVNSGTITMTTGDLAVTMTGTTPSFTNTGTIAVAGRTFTVTGGTLDLLGGVVSGYSGRLITTGTPTVRFTVPTVQPRVSFSATTVLPDPFTVPAGDSLRILGGTFAPPSLTNNGLLVLEGAPTVNSAVTTGTGSTIRVRGSGVGGGPTATFTNPLTNAAAIELTAETAGYNGVLIVPTLTNTATGTLTSLAGSGGTRTFTGTLVNAGAVSIPHDLILTGVDAAHVNSGTITMTTGDLAVTMTGTTPSFMNNGTIATNGRTFTVTGGTLDLLGGVVTGYTGRLVTTGAPTVRFTVPTVQPRVSFSATTVLPDPFTVPAGDSLRILGGTFAPPSLTNNGLLVLEGAPTVDSAVTTGTGSTIRVRGSGVGGGPTATFTNPLTNAAAIELTAEAAGYNGALIVPTLTNTATGTLTSLAGSGGTRTFTGTLVNAGAVSIPHDLILTGVDASHVNSGTITMTTGDLAVTMTGTTPSFTNTGTIATNGRTFTVTGGTLDLLGGVVTGYTGRLVTTGAPTVRFTVPTVQPRVTFSATTVLPDPFTVPANDSLRVFGGTFAPPSLTNDGLLILEGAPTITSAVTTGTGSTIRVRGTGIAGAPTATFTNPLTNAGAIELTAEAAGYNGVLIVPTLSNTATGTLTSLAGSGGTRTFTGTLVNAGAVNIPYDLSINGANAAHLNSGTLTMTTGDLTVTQSGAAPSFTNTGTIAANARTLTINTGAVELTDGLISGYGGRFITTGAAAVQFQPSNVQPRVTFAATTTVPVSLTVGVSDSLRVLGGTFAPTALVNNGFVGLEGTLTVNTAYTSGAGSTLAVRGVSQLANVTFTNGFTNNGTLTLNAEGAGYTVTLGLGTQTLTNSATGTIAIQQGSGGSRTINAALIDNLGSFQANATATVGAPLDQRGTMTVATGRTLTVSGLLSLYSGSSTTVTGALVKTGTCSNLGGTIGGTGTGATCP